MDTAYHEKTLHKCNEFLAAISNLRTKVLCLHSSYNNYWGKPKRCLKIKIKLIERRPISSEA